jgi:hypothetical protein
MPTRLLGMAFLMHAAVRYTGSRHLDHAGVRTLVVTSYAIEVLGAVVEHVGYGTTNAESVVGAAVVCTHAGRVRERERARAACIEIG